MVTNFDSVNQAGMWITQGAERSTETLLAMLRTALLLGVELVVDRNQLLDGVFFLALGPDRIASALGLEQGSPLPITMTASPADAPTDAPEVLVPRRLGSGEAKGPPISLARQLEDVRSPQFLSASSALAALTGSFSEHEWMNAERSTQWYPGCGFTDVLHPLPPDDHAAAMDVLKEAQDIWIRAAEYGRISVDGWSGEMDMEEALLSQRQILAEACDDECTPAPLAEHILTLTSTVRKDAVGELDAWDEAKRASPQELRLALRLWSRAYYQAIARKDDCMLVSFNDAGLVPDRPSGEQDRLLALARSFGLAMPPRSALERWIDRWRWQIRSGRPIRVEGEILDHLKTIDPGTYRQLSLNTRSVVASLINKRDPSAMYDLALACRNAVAVPPSHRRTRIVTALRIATMTLLAAAIAALTLVDEFAALSVGQRVAVVVGAALLGVLASLPYDDIVEQFNLRKTSMTATLDLRGSHE